ncbi:MAG: hypothetical protein MAG795_00360 [Candidatus Woesearchaeota archaeon]|nr:hypothetical protein [Candidatus Woesearchaeota archaeon]
MSSIDQLIVTAIKRINSDDPEIFMKSAYGLEKAERWIEENRSPEMLYLGQLETIMTAWAKFNARKEYVMNY